MLTSISLAENISDNNKSFLENYYQISPAANWELSLVDDCYCLCSTDQTLSMTLDFRSGNYRHRNQNSGKEPLIQAIKVKKKLPKTLFDATPGVLKDSFMLAARGIHITAFERNPLLYTMVKQALSRVDMPIDYYFGDAKNNLSNYDADIIYIDPMYPPKQKSAQVKKDMQILHQIIGADTDADELLIAAKSYAKNNTTSRIVVKRPNYANPLADKTPSFISQTGSTRFDVYL